MNNANAVEEMILEPIDRCGSACPCPAERRLNALAAMMDAVEPAPPDGNTEEVDAEMDEIEDMIDKAVKSRHDEKALAYLNEPDGNPMGTPWKKVRSNTTDVVRCSIVRYWIVVDVNGRLMADTCSERAADLIVRAVNSHAELVEACELASTLCDTIESWCPEGKQERPTTIEQATALRKALSNAKGGE